MKSQPAAPVLFVSNEMSSLWHWIQNIFELNINLKWLGPMYLPFVLSSPSCFFWPQSASSTAPMGIVCAWVHWSATNWITAATTAMRRTAPWSLSTLRRASSTVSATRCCHTLGLPSLIAHSVWTVCCSASAHCLRLIHYEPVWSFLDHTHLQFCNYWYF